jgi:hypothetical protein
MRLPGWLGALLAPAEDPRRGAPQAGLPNTEALLAELCRSRAELAELRQQLEARAAEMPPAQQERLVQQARELAEQEQELLRAEQDLCVSVEERRVQQVLEAARLRAVEAAIVTLSS